MEVGKYFACFSWPDIVFSGILDLCVGAIVDELGSFTFIGFSGGSLVWTIVVPHMQVLAAYPQC